MDKQNKMIGENLRLDRLAKQYERLDREMKNLVGPLYSRKDEEDLFGPIIASKKRNLDEIGYRSFWQGIRENEHLAPEDLRIVLNNFILVQKNYFTTQDATSPENAKKVLDQHKEMLFGKLNPLHSELEEKIRSLEKELGWIE